MVKVILQETLKCGIIKPAFSTTKCNSLDANLGRKPREVCYRRLDMNGKILEETQLGLTPEGDVSILSQREITPLAIFLPHCCT